jgi:hypothetical protein
MRLGSARPSNPRSYLHERAGHQRRPANMTSRNTTRATSGMRHFGRSRFEYFGPASLSRKPKLCGACLRGSAVTYDAGPLIRVNIPAPAADQIARGRPGSRHSPFAREAALFVALAVAGVAHADPMVCRTEAGVTHCEAPLNHYRVTGTRKGNRTYFEDNKGRRWMMIEEDGRTTVMPR